MTLLSLLTEEPRSGLAHLGNEIEKFKLMLKLAEQKGCEYSYSEFEIQKIAIADCLLRSYQIPTAPKMPEVREGKR